MAASDSQGTSGVFALEMNVVLKTKRLVLRSFHPNDVDAVYEFNKTAQWSPYLRTASEGYTRKNAEDFISRAILQDSRAFSQFAITMGRKVVGSIGLKMEPEHETGELKFSIGAPHSARGIATEAANSVLEYGFNGLGLFKIHARADARSTGVITMFGKIGMVQEGLLKGQKLHGDERIDEVLFGALRADWVERSNASIEELIVNK